MKWCKECVYPNIAVDFAFSDDGICSGCLSKKDSKKVNWDEAWKQLQGLNAADSWLRHWYSGRRNKLM